MEGVASVKNAKMLEDTSCRMLALMGQNPAGAGDSSAVKVESPVFVELVAVREKLGSEFSKKCLCAYV